MHSFLGGLFYDTDKIFASSDNHAIVRAIRKVNLLF